MRPAPALLRLVAPALALLAGGCAAPRLLGEGVSLHTILSGGYRVTDHDTFDGHPVYGLELVTTEPASGWGYEAGFHYGAQDEGGPRQHEGELDEYSLGLRHTWKGVGDVRSVLGFGLAYTVVEHGLSAPDLGFNEEGGAVYAHGGVLWDLGAFTPEQGTELLAGLDLRGLVGDDYDSLQLALVLAFGR